MKYLNSYSEYLVFIQKNNIRIDEKVRDELIKKSEKPELYRSKATAKLLHFEMLFGCDTKNDELLKKAGDITTNINNILEYILYFQNDAEDIKMNGDEHLSELNEMISKGQRQINEFVISCRDYYKEEWDKAKKV